MTEKTEQKGRRVSETLETLRREYISEPLGRDGVADDPVDQFDRWMQEAIAAHVPDANAMVLATADDRDHPAARIVLLKDYDHRGFVFYTNLESDKAQHLADNPQASLLFYWAPLNRQVRVEGGIEHLDLETNTAYFQSRPREAQIGAWASKQSRSLSSRDDLEAEFERLREKFGTDPIPLPPFWGGLRVTPYRYEFWQGRPNRLHDRIVYTAESDHWTIDRLAP